MKKSINYLTKHSLLAMVFAILLGGSAFGQNAANFNFANLVALKPLSGEGLTAGIAAKQNAVKVEDTPVRKPFQKQVTVTVNGSESRIVAMQIPTGKRFVIENVSVIVRCPQGRRMEVDYLTYLNNGAGAVDRTLHRLALQQMGNINTTAIFTANRQKRVLADERIGAEHFSVGVSARLLNSTSGSGQAQFTLTGYLEDLPAGQ